MGADIHLQLQIQKENWDGRKVWRPADFQPTDGYMDRNYDIFGLLASVRDSYPESLEPKGKVPNDELPDNWRWWITEDGKGGHECTEEQALRWGNTINSDRHANKWTIDPDLHSFSWLSYTEFKDVIKNYDNLPFNTSKLVTNYHILLGVMKLYKKRGIKSRIVFAFDN
jgi:hypothetical protein